MIKISESVDQCFPKPKTTSSNVLFRPQPKDIHFTVVEEERNQKIFTFKKLESENLHFFSLKSTQKRLINYQNRASLIGAALLWIVKERLCNDFNHLLVLDHGTYCIYKHIDKLTKCKYNFNFQPSELQLH